ADIDRVARHQAKRYHFAAVNHPVPELADFTRILCPGPANDIAEIAHREAHPFGSVHHAGSGAASNHGGPSCPRRVNDGFRQAGLPRCRCYRRPAMTEPALGIAGVVLLALAIVALFLRPRRSKGRMVDAGLAAGAGLLGLAIGLVIADRVHRPVAVLTAPTQPAAPATGYVESRLSLQFPIDDEYPTG